MTEIEMSLTVIGCSAAAPRPGGACSSYLVRFGEMRVLLDCGPDSLGVLRQHVNPRNLNAIVLSHLHADHTLDLVPLRYLLKYGPPEQTDPPERDRRIPLYVPPGGPDFLAGLGTAMEGNGGGDFWTPFEVIEYDPERGLEIGALGFVFAPTRHYIPCWAMRISPNETDSPVLVYGADTAPSESVVALAGDADLLILEATLPQPETQEPMGHLTPRQAGEMAEEAGSVSHLVLTHYWGNMEPADMSIEAETAFTSGTVSVAFEGETYTLTHDAP